MKYKNYRNPHTNDNRIFSFSDIYNMPLKEVFRRKQELLGQYRVLGVPREEELQSSENVVHIEAYTRDDGTEVRAHWRSKPDGVASNNFSHGNPTGGAAEVNNNYSNNIPQNFKDYMQSSKTDEQKTEQVENETDERLYPKEIAGVKRGKPMTYEKAGGKNVNPNYGNGDERYEKVCQSCVACWEARMRGYDLEVLPFNEASAELAANPLDIYINPKTGKTVISNYISGHTQDECGVLLNERINVGERHMIIYSPNEGSLDTHAVCAYKTADGELKIYDALTGEQYTPQEFVQKIKPSKILGSPFYPIQIARIDDKILDENIMKKITKLKN